ncbi:MAG: translocation/assembly module TamB domain-containing protein [Thiotrichaceae bacterium]
MTAKTAISKPSKTHKALRYLIVAPLSTLLIVLLLVVMGVFFLSATNSGSAILLNRLSDTFADLDIEGVNGSLLGDLNIQRILWEKDGLNIEIIDAKLKGLGIPPNIYLNSLTSKRITISLPKDDAEQKQYKPFEITLPDLHLPIDVNLKNVAVDELHIIQGDALVKLRNVQLSTKVVSDTLELSNLSGDLYDDDGEVIVKAKGELGLSSPHLIHLDINTKANSKRIGVGELNLAVKGEVIDYQLSANGHWKYAEYPKYALTLSGNGNLEQLTVKSLHLDGNSGSANLTGRMTWAPELNWDLTLTGDGLNPAAFIADYSGDLDMEWVTTGSLTATANIQLELKKFTGHLQDYPIDAAMQLTINDEIFSLKSLHASVGDNRLTADGHAVGTDANIALNWQLDAPKLEQLHATLSGNLAGKGKLTGKRDGSQFSIFIETLKGKVLDYPIAAKGGVKLDGQLVSAENLNIDVGNNHFTLNGSADEAHGIDWQINANNLSQLYPEIAGRLKGKGNAKGLLDGSRAALHIETLQGALKVKTQGQTKSQNFPVNASGDIKLQNEAITLQNLKLGVGKNRLTLNGNSAEDLGINWQINAPNLNPLSAGVSGHVKGTGMLSGALDGSAYKLRISTLKGKVEGRPLDIKGDVTSEAGKLTLHNLTVLAGSNHLQAHGKASEPFDLRWNIDAPKLSQVWPGLGGSLKGGGILTGNLEKLQIKADLTGKRLRYDGLSEVLSIASVDLKADQRGDIYTLEANLKNLKQGESVIPNATIDGKGKLTNHIVKLDIQHQDGKVNLLAKGGWNNEQWQGTLQKLGLRDTPAGNWQLNNPVEIKASAQQVSTSNFCLSNNRRGSVCATSEWSVAKGIKTKGKLTQIPLAMGKPWIPANLSLPGLVNAEFDFSQINGKPKGRIDIRLPNNSLIIKDDKGRPETLQYSNAQANVTINNQRANLKATFDIKGRGQLHAEGQVDLVQNAKGYQPSRINAKANIKIPDIHWVQQFSKDIDELKGNLDSDILVKGTLGKPIITGSAHLKNASLFLPETGAHLQAINLTAQTNRADQMIINGSLKAGQGTLQANGKLYLANLPNWKADLTLVGERLLLMNTHEVQAQVSPNLVIKAQPQSVVITGTVKIPETTITLREIPTSAKQRSDDIVIVGRENNKRTHRSQPSVKNKTASTHNKTPLLDIKPNVSIELGDKVSFSGFGFNSRLTGKIRVQKTRQDIVTQGALNIVDGIYKAYGQELEIERGRLIFDGTVDNPGLDIRAIRKIPGDILVGIALRGTAQHPESELFSEPQQSETDTLSYLLTGNSVASATSGDSALLNSAISGLGIKGGETLAQKIGGGVGLDDVGISSSTGNYRDSELSLGKQLSSRLYVKYIVGLFDSLQKVAVTYQINKRLQAGVLSGEQQEIDLNYKFDTNKGLFGR